MNKFKKILLGALAVLTLGLVAVTGARVNAASTAYKADSFNGVAANEKVGPFTISRAFTVSSFGTFQSKSNLSLDSSCTDRSLDDFTYEAKTASSTALTVSLASDETANVSVYWYDNGGKNVSIGAGSSVDATNKKVAKLSGTLDSTNNSINFSSGNIILLEVDIEIISATYTVNYANSNSNVSVALPNSESNVRTLTSAMLPDLEYAGYRFTGWYFESACTNKASTSSTLSTYASNGSVTLYAGWELISDYKVTFVVDDNEYAVRSVSLSGDHLISDWPTNPTKVGYEFVGWQKDNTIYTSTFEFTSDLTLIAKFDLKIMSKGSKYNLNYLDYVPGDTAKEIQAGKYAGLLNDSSNDYFENDYFIINDTNGNISVSDNSGFKLAKNATIQSNYIAFNVPESSVVKIKIGDFRSTSTGKSTTITISDGTLNKTFSTSLSTASNRYDYYNYVNDSANYKTIYIYNGSGQNCKINSLSVEIVDYATALNGDFATASVFAEKNGDGTKLRFVGTITGITDLASVEKIELILGKNGTLASNPINLTKCYTSVEGSSQTCEVADGTYYTIFRLSGIKSLPGGTKISKQLKVTFTDGSTTSSEPSEITL